MSHNGSCHATTHIWAIRLELDEDRRAGANRCLRIEDHRGPLDAPTFGKLHCLSLKPARDLGAVAIMAPLRMLRAGASFRTAAAFMTALAATPTADATALCYMFLGFMTRKCTVRATRTVFRPRGV